MLALKNASKKLVNRHNLCRIDVRPQVQFRHAFSRNQIIWLEQSSTGNHPCGRGGYSSRIMPTLIATYLGVGVHLPLSIVKIMLSMEDNRRRGRAVCLRDNQEKSGYGTEQQLGHQEPDFVRTSDPFWLNARRWARSGQQVYVRSYAIPHYRNWTSTPQTAMPVQSWSLLGSA